MRRAAFAVMLAVALMGGLLVTAAPASAQTFKTILNGWLETDKLTVNTSIDVATDAAVGGVLSADTAKLTAATAATITAGGSLAPAGSYQPITAADNVGFSDITVSAAGTLLVLVNEANVTITITDTGTNKLAGNVALGQYDSVTLLSDGTNWVQVATSNN